MTALYNKSLVYIVHDRLSVRREIRKKFERIGAQFIFLEFDSSEDAVFELNLSLELPLMIVGDLYQPGHAGIDSLLEQMGLRISCIHFDGASEQKQSNHSRGAYLHVHSVDELMQGAFELLLGVGGINEAA